MSLKERNTASEALTDCVDAVHTMCRHRLHNLLWNYIRKRSDGNFELRTMNQELI